jgi:hypothetical protein
MVALRQLISQLQPVDGIGPSYLQHEVPGPSSKLSRAAVDAAGADVWAYFGSPILLQRQGCHC